METMITSQKGRDFIKSYEKCSLKPYFDKANPPVATIGWGNTFYPNGEKVKITDTPISQLYADKLFSIIIGRFENDVNFLLGKVVVSQNQFDALVSFAYNVGSDIDKDTKAEGLGDSTLMRKVLANPNDASIVAEFLKWVSKGTVNEKGLTKRRQAEANIYSRGIYVNHI